MIIKKKIAVAKKEGIVVYAKEISPFDTDRDAIKFSLCIPEKMMFDTLLLREILQPYPKEESTMGGGCSGKENFINRVIDFTTNNQVVISKRVEQLPCSLLGFDLSIENHEILIGENK